MIHIKPGATYQGRLRHDAEELEGKTLEQRAKILKRRGLGYEDIYVELRHLGMTKEYAREIVFGKPDRTVSAPVDQIALPRRGE